MLSDGPQLPCFRHNRTTHLFIHHLREDTNIHLAFPSTSILLPSIITQDLTIGTQRVVDNNCTLANVQLTTKWGPQTCRVRGDGPRGLILFLALFIVPYRDQQQHCLSAIHHSLHLMHQSSFFMIATEIEGKLENDP